MLPNDDAAIEEARRILFAARRGDGGEIVEVSVGCAGPARVRWLGAWRRPVGGAARWSTAV
jgi:electron transfer flavoprotein alpha/beta subunit